MYTVNKKFQKLIILANCEFSSMKHQLYSSKKKKKKKPVSLLHLLQMKS